MLLATEIKECVSVGDYFTDDFKRLFSSPPQVQSTIHAISDMIPLVIDSQSLQTFLEACKTIAVVCSQVNSSSWQKGHVILSINQMTVISECYDIDLISFFDIPGIVKLVAAHCSGKVSIDFIPQLQTIAEGYQYCLLVQYLPMRDLDKQLKIEFAKK
jgi:hypothetical protein